MSNTYFYRAFGLTIESAFPIAQIPVIEPCVADVRIIPADLSGVPQDERQAKPGRSCFVYTTRNTNFRVSDGRLIEAHVMDGDSDSYVAVYLLGSCMGAILIQRGFMLLHGSCVTDGRRSILISGNSGAGKSTLAAEFLKRGWKLVTDDVTCIFERDGKPMVQPSYPSQKLWRDAMDRYEKSGDDVHSLYVSADREKFGINVAASFYDDCAPLSLFVRLMPTEYACGVAPVEGMTKMDQLMRNSYRAYFMAEEDRPRHFQRCIDLSQKIPMALALREKGRDCAPILFEKIIKFLEEHYHD